MNLHTGKWLLLVGALALAVGLAIGLGMGGGGHEHAVDESSAGTATAEVWTCSMHPQIRMPGPGKCPICAMDLIPVSGGEEGEELGARQIKLSERARQLAQIQTAHVQRRLVEVEARMVGKIDFDETRLRYITARVPGRIERLYVDYTGVPVRPGDHLASLYSPELLTAQKELVQALRTTEELRDNKLVAVRESTRQTLEAAREKLRLWGLRPEQIESIEKERKPSDQLTIYASAGGVVVEKMVSEGDYVETGMRLYAIADLSQVWLKLEAYESDLLWIHYGQEVEFETEAYPGTKFRGRIAFVDPVLDESTRTVKLRVNVGNADGRLKPGMFARAVVRARAAADGRVLDPALAGKWISPMHPEIVKDGPGQCDICGMALVPARQLGYMSREEEGGERPLVVPASAVLLTGKRAVAYVAVPGREGVFEGREVVLGPRAGDYYLVREGLAEGEEVVTNGNFKIDSALQIRARPSMMSPQGGASAAGHQHGSAAAPESRGGAPPVPRERLGALLAGYFSVHQALGHDNLAEAQSAVGGVLEVLQAAGGGEGALREALYVHAEEVHHAVDIQAARRGFAGLSTAVEEAVERFGAGLDEPVHRFHCPMAFGDEGARWLQKGEAVENPYQGQQMYRCGTRETTLAGPAGRESGR